MKKLIPKDQKGEKLFLHAEPKREWLADWTKKNFPKVSAFGESVVQAPYNPLRINPINVVQTAADFTGVPGVVNAVSGNPMNLPEHEVAGAMLPAVSVGKKLAGEAESLASKIPQEWKDMPIKGVTVDDAEKGFHALNAKHWALHPGKLVSEAFGTKEAVPLKDKLMLYGEAVGNRLMSPLMKTPLKYPIKKVAEKVMNISGGAPTMSTGKLKDIAHKTPEFGKYAGSLSGATLENRNLIKTYLYGKPGSMVEAGEDVSKIPLGDRYNKLYPKAKTYMMHSEVKHGEPIYSDAYQLSTIEQGAVGRVSSPVGAIDDIGGHMIQQKMVKNKPTLITQDLWKFNPKDYSSRWGGEEGNAFMKLNAEKQAGMLDKVGKPFYLVQNNPIVEVSQNIPKSKDRFNLAHDWNSNTLQAPPQEITFKRMGGKLICKR